MKLAALSAIHGNLPALQAVLADIDAEGSVQAVVDCGHILSGPLESLKTAELLMARRIPMIAVFVAHGFQPMAQLAARRSRPDWARPVCTGCMS
jgi:hypothetical protein